MAAVEKASYFVEVT